MDIGTSAWASLAPLDDGTGRVVSDGMRTIYDPDGLRHDLTSAAGRSGRPSFVGLSE
jgi:hypothetical protein